MFHTEEVKKKEYLYEVFMKRYIFYGITITLMCISYCLGNLKEKHFKIIVPSYNNQEWCQKNLNSILDQKYENYQILYMNDCSSDATKTLVEEIQKKHEFGNKITLINNGLRGKQLRNIYAAVHTLCDDDDIVFIIDGDDWLELDQKNILQEYNTLFSENDVWFVYGNSRKSTEKKAQEYCKDCVMPAHKIGSLTRVPVWVKHPRLFYAWLFKSIRLDSFLYQGAFLVAAADASFCYPLIELSGAKQMFYKRSTYVYNQKNPMSYHVTIPKHQKELNNYVLAQKPYDSLNQKHVGRNRSTFDTFIVMQDIDANSMRAFCESITGRGQIYLLFDPQKVDKDLIQTLSQEYDNFIFCDQTESVQEMIYLILKERSQLADYIFVTNAIAYIKNHDAIYSLMGVVNNNNAYVGAFASISGFEGSKSNVEPVAHCSYMYDNFYAMQLGWKPQFSAEHSLESILYQTENFMRAVNEGILFSNDLDLNVQKNNSLSFQAGILALTDA